MLMIGTIPEAIGLMMVGIVLLGTWPAVWNLIEQRGRVPSHIFLDYALTYLVLGTAVALTLGQLGPATPGSPPFLQQLSQDNSRMVAFALAGGFCLAFGDLGMQYATALLGLSIGPPLLNALTVIIGVVLAYFLDGGINKPQLVFPGMACAAVAIALGAAAHVLSQRRSPHGTRSRSTGSRAECSAAAAAAAQADVAGFDDSARPKTAAGQFKHDADSCDQPSRDTLSRLHCQQQRQPQQQDQLQGNPAGTATGTSAVALHIDIMQQQQQQEAAAKLQQQRSIQLGSNSRFLGLAVAVLGGTVYGLFLPAFQIAATDPFNLLPPGTPPLTVYTTNFWFSVGFAATSIVINGIFLYKPPFGTQASSVTGYIRDNRGRGLSILSGALAAFGDLSQFMGGQVAGYAACMLVMAYPVVGVLWGMVRFKEFRQASKASLALIAAQVAAYSTAVALLASSAELRTGAGHH
ncbi:ureide permease-domain-containing protein [Scenedesmus sp. NREL 46B-D3]|nr:ureide permease-domain-containing protein [Scenedesmus sp. NREL 46B-D3]